MSATHAQGLLGISAGVGPVRRGLDIAISLIVLAAALPVLVVIAIAIRLTSRGPIMFHQQRVGQGGSIFTLHKFRTMIAGSSGPEFTVRGDTRVTRVGRFLRAGHLDELPQFANVLRAEMTLVGPRPETPALAARYPPELRQVLAFRPGMTGPCQVFMGESSPPPGADAEDFYLTQLVPRRVALDMKFLEHPTLRATVAMLLATLAVIVRLRKAERVRLADLA
jgi:lipopolysaccharide/colanic/teichoic acid biosynthesis glycosyltransferase